MVEPPFGGILLEGAQGGGAPLCDGLGFDQVEVTHWAHFALCSIADYHLRVHESFPDEVEVLLQMKGVLMCPTVHGGEVMVFLELEISEPLNDVLSIELCGCKPYGCIQGLIERRLHGRIPFRGYPPILPEQRSVVEW